MFTESFFGVISSHHIINIIIHEKKNIIKNNVTVMPLFSWRTLHKNTQKKNYLMVITFVLVVDKDKNVLTKIFS